MVGSTVGLKYRYEDRGMTNILTRDTDMFLVCSIVCKGRL